jgi:Acetyltransferase (GNAT) domain
MSPCHLSLKLVQSGIIALEERTCRPIVDGRPARVSRKEDRTFVFDDRPVGWVSLFDFNLRNRSAEFGYGLIRLQRGKGLGRRMLSCAFGRLFATTELNKLHCQTASFNVASARLLESLGLVNQRRPAVEALAEPCKRGDAVEAIM